MRQRSPVELRTGSAVYQGKAWKGGSPDERALADDLQSSDGKHILRLRISRLRMGRTWARAAGAWGGTGTWARNREGDLDGVGAWFTEGETGRSEYDLPIDGGLESVSGGGDLLPKISGGGAAILAWRKLEKF